MREQIYQYERPIGPEPLPDIETLLAVPPVRVTGYNSMDESEFDVMADELRMGRLPDIGYFTLAVDTTSVDTQYIHHLRYTQYHANWQVPVTPDGHDNFLHDSYHATVAERMFRSPLMAVVVGGAAQNCLRSGRTEYFTHQMDYFGDAMLDVVDAFTGPIACMEARVFLEDLVSMYLNDPQKTDLHRRISDHLAVELGIDEHSQRVADILDQLSD